MKKGELQVKYFLDTASVDELQQFHNELVTKNHGQVFDTLLKCLSEMIDEKRGVLV